MTATAFKGLAETLLPAADDRGITRPGTTIREPFCWHIGAKWVQNDLSVPTIRYRCEECGKG